MFLGIIVIIRLKKLKNMVFSGKVLKAAVFGPKMSQKAPRDRPIGTL